MKSNNEIRLENLENLINEAGSQEKLADVSGVSRIYLNQIKKQRPDPTTGKTRNVGDSVARKLEAGMGKPVGWLDQVHTIREQSNQYHVNGYIQLPYLEIESSAGDGKYAIEHPPILQYLNVLEGWASITAISVSDGFVIFAIIGAAISASSAPAAGASHFLPVAFAILLPMLGHVITAAIKAIAAPALDEFAITRANIIKIIANNLRARVFRVSIFSLQN